MILRLVPVTCIITGITYDFAYYIRCIPIVSKKILDSFGFCFMIFLFPENVYYQIYYRSLQRITVSGYC
jgi:hypothetical protein